MWGFRISHFFISEIITIFAMFGSVSSKKMEILKKMVKLWNWFEIWFCPKIWDPLKNTPGGYSPLIMSTPLGYEKLPRIWNENAKWELEEVKFISLGESRNWKFPKSIRTNNQPISCCWPKGKFIDMQKIKIYIHMYDRNSFRLKTRRWRWIKNSILDSVCLELKWISSTIFMVSSTQHVNILNISIHQ